jgi:hypothetical protein
MTEAPRIVAGTLLAYVQSFVRFEQVIAIAICCGGCSTTTVSLWSARAPAPPAGVLKIDLDTTSVHLPLRVDGARVTFTDVDRALTQSLQNALRPFTLNLGERHAAPLALFVELIDAHADYAQERLVVRMTVRATLRERSGNSYVAQTHAHFSSSGATTPERGAPIALSCSDAIAGQLSGWLSGMDLR